MSEPVEIGIQCPCCGELHAVTIDFDGFMRWQNGELIQNALPNLTPAQRELLISGICEECWNKTFATAEEE